MTKSPRVVNTSSPEDIFHHALTGGIFVKCTLSKNQRQSAEDFQKVSARLITLNDESVVQLTYHYPRKETHENLSEQDAARRIAELLQTVFEHGHLFTSENDYVIRKRPNGMFRVKLHSPTTSKPVAATHDRAKQYLIPEGTVCPFLVEIGVMNSQGRVLAAKQKKFRQINRFLELVDDIVKFLPRERPLRVVDFGCGKSYLTFALHHLLTQIHDFEVDITGVDRLESVVRTCRQIAERLQCRGLEFQSGDIKSFSAEKKVDLAVSLHACDTATDDALAQAVRWNAEVILAVPCCQHELANRLENHELRALTQHGILKERFAALATDALRAAALEICDYSTAVVEFIDMEHTAKNLLIRAVKRPGSQEGRVEHITAYQNLKRQLSLNNPYLEQVLAPLAQRIAE